MITLSILRPFKLDRHLCRMLGVDPSVAMGAEVRAGARLLLPEDDDHDELAGALIRDGFAIEIVSAEEQERRDEFARRLRKQCRV